MNEEILRQNDDPLYRDLIWSRPETKHGAGKLLIIGGQAQEFIHVAQSFTAAEKAGIGTVRVVMPDSTQKATKMLPNIEYAPSNNSGSFSRAALAELLDAALWSDGVLLAGDLGKNSETSLLLESFITKYTGQLTISSDTLSSLTVAPIQLLERGMTNLALTFNDLQKIGMATRLETAITSTITNRDLAYALRELTNAYAASLAVQKQTEIWTSFSGSVAVTTKKSAASNIELASEVAVWSLQNPQKTFESITTAAYHS